MKADKILFGIACVGMGLMFNSVLKRNSAEPVSRSNPSINMRDTFFIKQTLDRDTFELSKPVSRDTSKLIKRIIK